MQAEEALTPEILALQRMQGQLRRQRLYQAEQAEEGTATQAAWGKGKEKEKGRRGARGAPSIQSPDNKPEQRRTSAGRSFKGRKKRAIRSCEHQAGPWHGSPRGIVPWCKWVLT